jgi:hypothetical protein
MRSAKFLVELEMWPGLDPAKIAAAIESAFHGRVQYARPRVTVVEVEAPVDTRDPDPEPPKESFIVRSVSRFFSSRPSEQPKRIA